MRFRTKLAIALSLLAVVTGAMVLVLFYFGSRDILMQQIRSKVLSIAASAAVTVDGNLHETIRTRGDEESEAYRTIQRQLREFRDANRREDVRVRFVYTMRPSAEKGWIYVVDAEAEEAEKSHVGDPVVFESDSGEQLALDRPYAEKSFSRDAFGVWLSANAPIRDSAGKPVALLGVDVASGDVLARVNRLLKLGFAALGLALIAAVGLAAVLAGRAATPLEKIRASLQQIATGDWSTRVEVHSKDEFGKVADAVNGLAIALRDRENLKGALARYVSRDVADQVLQDAALPSLRGVRREITVLIADIRNFTALSEKLGPDALVRFLNIFFEHAIEAVFKHGGTLDKFLGDGLLAIFNAPLDDPDHRANAVKAALEILRRIGDLQREMKEEHDIDFRVGIGIHSGTAVVGNVGSTERMEYTAIGETVNVASRIESLNKEYGTDILASETVAVGNGGEFTFQEVAEARLRGVGRLVKVFTVAASPAESEEPAEASAH